MLLGNARVMGSFICLYEMKFTFEMSVKEEGKSVTFITHVPVKCSPSSLPPCPHLGPLVDLLHHHGHDGPHAVVDEALQVLDCLLLIEVQPKLLPHLENKSEGGRWNKGSA